MKYKYKIGDIIQATNYNIKKDFIGVIVKTIKKEDTEFKQEPLYQILWFTTQKPFDKIYESSIKNKLNK